jgi:2-dehydropantoate 2-reductase
MNTSSKLSVAIVGTGAMGGLLGFRFAAAGFPVTFLERGERLAALRGKGLTLIGADGRTTRMAVRQATDQPHTVGAHDLVILAVKAHQIADVASDISPLLHSDSAILTIQNGIPWWYFQNHGGEFDGLRLKSLDPLGVIERSIPAKHIVGCVAYPAATVAEPGVVVHVEGDRFPIGELDGASSDRCFRISEAFQEAGFRSRVLDDIRNEIWLKAWGSLTFNPISALTGATMEDICRHPQTRDLAARMMNEARAVAEKLGVKFRHTIERRLEGAEKVGPHKTSMLQDVEAGATLEVEALIGSVVELAELTGTPVPAVNAVYACLGLLDRKIQTRLGRVELLT